MWRTTYQSRIRIHMVWIGWNHRVRSTVSILTLIKSELLQKTELSRAGLLQSHRKKNNEFSRLQIFWINVWVIFWRRSCYNVHTLHWRAQTKGTKAYFHYTPQWAKTQGKNPISNVRLGGCTILLQRLKSTVFWKIFFIPGLLQGHCVQKKY